MEKYGELRLDIPLDDFLPSDSDSTITTPSPMPDPVPNLCPSSQSEESADTATESLKSEHFGEILARFQVCCLVECLLESLECLDERDRVRTLHLLIFSDVIIQSLYRGDAFSVPPLIQRQILCPKDILFQRPFHRQMDKRSVQTVSSLSDCRPFRPIDNLSVSLYSAQSSIGNIPSVISSSTNSLIHRMMVSNSQTLAFVSQNFVQIIREFGSANLSHRDFKGVSMANIVFKSTNPVLVKDQVLLFDASFVTATYHEHPITAMISSSGHYAPLLGKHAEESGFGPPILAEFEDRSVELHQFLREGGNERDSLAPLRVSILPPLNVCSLPSLAAHYLHKSMNVNQCEEQICFVMIQLLGALKCLQSDGIEHLSNNFREFVLSYPNPLERPLIETIDQLPRLLLLRDAMEEECDDRQSESSFGQNGTSQVAMCRFGLRALCTLMNRRINSNIPDIAERSRYSTPLRQCAQILSLDRSSSLTDAKAILEFAFFAWGQSFDSETEAKLWLDERRSQFIGNLIRWLIERSPEIVSARQQFCLQFLLSATPRSLLAISRQSRRK